MNINATNKIELPFALYFQSGSQSHLDTLIQLIHPAQRSLVLYRGDQSDIVFTNGKLRVPMVVMNDQKVKRL